ncbi:MAG: alpha/beta hydrolase, partial [Pseudomonadota bacterium]
FLSGGPGLSGMAAARYPGAYPWTRNRDVVIFAQRGTPDARPALECLAFNETLTAHSGDSGLSAQIAAAHACRQRLVETGISLDAYHTAASAADIEAIREFLDTAQVALYAGSYGTRLALTYAREYPDRVSSMVLDSPLPHSADYDTQYPQNFRDRLRAIARSCAEQEQCGKAYPHLTNRFETAIADAGEHPWTVTVDGGREVSITASDLLAALSDTSGEGISNTPFIMDAIARKDVAFLKPLLARRAAPTPFAWGMRLSVWCSEALAFSARRNRTAPENAALTFAGLDGAVVDPSVCAAWNVPARPQSEKATTLSSVPTLILAGEFDADTPPRWGYDAAKTLGRSHVVTVPFGGHMETTNWDGDGCAMAIAASFFDDEAAFLSAPQAASPCLADRAPPVFAMPRGQ